MKNDNKSQKVRDYIAANPNATAGEILEAMQKERVSVSKPLIYKLLADGKKTASPSRRGENKSNGPDGTVSVTALLETKKLAEQLGSTEEIQKALKLLAKLNA